MYDRSTRGTEHTPTSPHLVLRLGGASDRETIYCLRHQVYAEELGQHPVNPQRRLRDPLDDYNLYILACEDGKPSGFVSITPPGEHRYSIDKYLDRQELPFRSTKVSTR